MKVLRFAAAIGLLVALFYFHLIDVAALHRAVDHPTALTAAVLLSFMVIPVAALRWHLLLGSQGLILRLRETLRIVAISTFFAMFLPGGAGGDLVRGVYIARATQGRRTGALLSIIIDRLIGFAGFILVSVIATLGRPRRSYGTFEYGVFALAALFAVAIMVLFKFGHPIAITVNRLFHNRSRRIASIIEAIGEALRLYATQWRLVALSLALSTLIVVLLTVAIITIAVAMQFNGLSPVEYGIAGIYAMVANVIPITPGGIGVGEGAFASACIMLEPTNAGIAYGTIFLVFRCAMAIAALPGLGVYLVYPHRASLLTPINPSA
ncbi:MAG: lysylphosphatidylglycerol synthase transmembrane domain-containing protein [Candidatus Binataceae bacterium]